MHGELACHLGMEIRFLTKEDRKQGLVQDTLGIIIWISTCPEDGRAYQTTSVGQLFDAGERPGRVLDELGLTVGHLGL